MSTATHENRTGSKQGRNYVVVTLVLLLGLAAMGAVWLLIGYPYYHHRQLLNQANVYVETLEVDEAERVLKEVLSDWPDNAETHFLLGRIYRLMEKFTDSHAHLRKAEDFGW